MKNNKQKNIEEIINNLGIKTTNYWKNLLKTLPTHEIGVIKISGKLLEKSSLNQLCAELSYLANETGFYLPLVFGGGIQYDDYSTEKVNGIRITPKNLIERIAKIAFENQKNIVNKLNEAGVNAVAIPSSTFIVQPHGYEVNGSGNKIDTGYVGDIVTINTKPIISAINESKIPVISHLGYCNNEPYNINATTLAKELVKFLQAKKLIIIGNKPVLDKNGEIIKTISSELEFKKLVNDGTINGGMVDNVKEAYALLNYLGPRHSVQITSLKTDPEGNLQSTGLLEELLGNGSGTLILTPSIITSLPLYNADKKLLTNLINNAFAVQGRYLADNYFDIVSSKNPTVYLDETKNGGAITYHIDDFEYMCKLFVKQDYEGLGIASNLIENIYLQKQKLSWRASKKNKEGICFFDKIKEKYKGFAVETEGRVVYGLGIPKSKKYLVAKKVSEIPSTLKLLK